MAVGISRWFTMSRLTTTTSSRFLASAMACFVAAVPSSLPQGPASQVTTTFDSRSSWTLMLSDAASLKSTTAGSGS